MKITFVLSGLYVGGGTKVVFEHSNRLRSFGHKVNIVYPFLPIMTGKSVFHKSDLRYIARTVRNNSRSGNRLDWFGLDTKVSKIPFLHSWFVPDGDVIIATEWTTASFVNSLSINKGKKVYFVQGYETFIGKENEVNKTYKLPMHKIVVSTWLQNLLCTKFNQTSDIVINGVNLDLFFPDPPVQRADSHIKRILMLYHSNPVKGVQDGIAAFEKVRKKVPNARLVMFGAWKGKEIPPWVEFHENPSHQALKKLYCSSDIFLSPSRMEGGLLPPMEAMACGIPTVLTNVGGVPDYAIPEVTALVSEPGKPDMLANNLIRLLQNKKLASKIGKAGYQHIKGFSWEASTSSFENVLTRLIGGMQSIPAKEIAYGM